MNNRLPIYIGLIIGIIIVFGVLIFFFVKPGTPKVVQNNQVQTSSQPTVTPTPAPVSFIHFSFTKYLDAAQNKPFSTDLLLTMEKDISNKGFIGIKTTIKVDPATLATISKENIQGLFPAPWQYIRKDVSEDGAIRVEAIYLQPGKTGYIIKEDTPFIRLTFTPKQKGTLTLTLDPSGTQILTKENNTKATITRETKETFAIK